MGAPSLRKMEVDDGDAAERAGSALKEVEGSTLGNLVNSVRFSSGKHKFHVKWGRPDCVIVAFESGAVSLLLLLLARAGVLYPGSLCVYDL